MNARTRVAYCWTMLLLCMVSPGACSEPGDDARTLVKLFRYVKSLETDMDFYGKVLDQYDKPVIGAKVKMHVSYFEPLQLEGWFHGIRDYEAKTGVDGRFELTGIRGWDISIEGISAAGYEYNIEENPRYGFKYTMRDEIGKPFVPDKTKPVIFRMRKKLQNRTYLFEDRNFGLHVTRRSSGKIREFDIVQGRRIRPDKPRESGEFERVCDLRYGATFDEESGRWDIVFSTCGRDGEGIFVSNEKLYLAPETGYRESWSFSVKDRTSDPLYVYVKSRSPAIYSRIEIADIGPTNEHVWIEGRSTTNPYGDRVLDAVDFAGLTSHQIVTLTHRLEAEARVMLADGRLPQRPKIMALIEGVRQGVITPEELERETKEWKTDKNPNYLFKYWERALEKEEAHDYRGAIAELDELIRRAGRMSDYAHRYWEKGRLLVELGDYKAAIECFRTGAEQFPKEVFLYTNSIIETRKKMGDYKGALRDLEEINELHERRERQRLEEVEKELEELDGRRHVRTEETLTTVRARILKAIESWKEFYKRNKEALESDLEEQEPGK